MQKEKGGTRLHYPFFFFGRYASIRPPVHPRELYFLEEEGGHSQCEEYVPGPHYRCKGFFPLGVFV